MDIVVVGALELNAIASPYLRWRIIIIQMLVERWMDNTRTCCPSILILILTLIIKKKNNVQSGYCYNYYLVILLQLMNCNIPK
jgi:hypothetical protein